MVPFARKCLVSGIVLIGLVPALQLAQLTPAQAASYVVQPNETLSGIALRFHISVWRLARLNGIANPDEIHAGQVLTVPDGTGYARQRFDDDNGRGQAGQVPESGYTNAPATTGQGLGTANTNGPDSGVQYGLRTEGSYYIVMRGDTLSGLSARFGVPLAVLAATNGISRLDMVRVGQRLLIPGQSTGNQAAGDQATDDQAIGTRTFPLSPAAAVTPVAPAPQATATPGTSLTVPSISQTDVGTLLTQAATSYGLDPALAKAVAWQESGWRMVVARDGGIGVMQLMPATVAWVGPVLLGRTIDPYNVQDNIQAGVALLAYYMRRYGDVRQALAAYNEGPNNLARGLLSSTARYVANVLALEGRFAS
jgi:LysM repeat protein